MVQGKVEPMKAVYKEWVESIYEEEKRTNRESWRGIKR